MSRVRSRDSTRSPRRLLRTAEQGADTITWLAASPEAAKVDGVFWLDREPHVTHVFPGTDPTPEERRQLWEVLTKLTADRKARPAAR